MKRLLITLTAVFTLTACTSHNHEVQGTVTHDGEYYLFTSHDKAVIWAISPNDIAFTPAPHTEYTLVYNNNGTTADNYQCNIAEDHDCECYLYDDEFIALEGVQ